MTKYEFISIILQAISLAIQSFALWGILISYRTYREDIQKDQQQSAPNFAISSVIYQLKSMEFSENTYKDPKPRQFLFQKRQVYDIERETFKSYSCLILNLCLDYKDQSRNIPICTKLYNIDKIQLYNTGSMAVSFQIEKIRIKQSHLDEAIEISPEGNEISPEGKNTLYQIIEPNESINILLSFLLDVNVPIFAIDQEQDEEYIKSKKDATGGELLNTTVDQLKTVDLWDSMQFDILTTNKQGKSYSQKLEFVFEDNTYFAKYHSPILKK